MESPIGKELDTDFHEATMFHRKNNQKGKIIDVIEKGYFLGE